VHVCVCVCASVFEGVRGIHKDKDIYGCCICHLSLSLKTCAVYVCTSIYTFTFRNRHLFFVCGRTHWWKKKNPGIVKGACPAMSKSKGERDSCLQGLVRINIQTDEKHPLNIECMHDRQWQTGRSHSVNRLEK
jgi:hypothetical protein